MKRSVVLVGCVVLSLLMSFSAFAVELTKENVKKAPLGYAKVEKDKVIFGKTITAYSPETFNQLMGSYGLTFSKDALKNVPPSYAKADKDKIVYGKTVAAYDPDTLNKILNAYGATLSPEAVKAGKVPKSYAKLEKDKIVYGKVTTAYAADDYNKLLAAYATKQVVAEAPKKEVPPPAPAPKAEPKAIAAPAPIGDSDGDGVPDNKDKCPDTPKGAKVNAVGCWIVQGLFFDTGKADIKPAFTAGLDDVVTVLKQNPTMKVEIQGHTDNVGGKAYNQKLSDKRAKAVRDYFVQKGIDGNRLTSKGYGFSRPVAPNKTADGKAQNRRVELKPLK